VTIPAELLRAGFPYHQLIPTYLTREQDGDQGPVPMLEEDCEQWREAVQHVALTATHYLTQAREQQSSVPKHARATLLPVVPALQYLEKLEKAQFNVFDSHLVTGSKSDRLRLLFLLGRTWMTGVF
jgi:phytoene/squalene synthetase